MASGGAASVVRHPSVAPRLLRDARRGHKLHFIVLLRPTADLRAAASAQGRRGAGRDVVTALRRTAAAQAPVERRLRRLGASYHRFWVADALAVTGDRRTLRAMRERPDVRAIEADDPVSAIGGERPADTAADGNGIEWNIGWVKAPDVWALGDTGKGITVASADSGVEWNHPALRDHYRGWHGGSVRHAYNWWDGVRSPVDPSNPSSCGYELSAPCDDIGHGTHTTGTMVGDDGAGNEIGVAPGAKWIACRNLDNNRGTPSTFLSCLQWLLAPTNLAGANPEPFLRPDVVNNSYVCSPQEGCAPLTLQSAYDSMRAAGIFMSTAAGNSGPSCSSSGDPPAIYDSAISVGATSFRSNFIAFFSSRGPITADGSGRMKPDLAAPGSDVRSSFLGGSYKSLHGTSMAAPHVAGAVALLWSAFPQLRRDVDQTEQILEQSALHQPSTACGSSGSPNNVYGYGTINVFDAYAEAERRYPPQLSVADASVVKPSAGSTELRFPVGLSRASTNDISVRYATLDGSAAAPVDYSATSGVITIPSGETEATVSVPVTGDTRCKAEDSLRLELSDPTDAGLGRSSAAGLIDTSKLCSDQGRESSGRGEATSR